MARESLLQIRMSFEERKVLKAAADRKGLSESAMARMLIKEGLEKDKKS